MSDGRGGGGGAVAVDYGLNIPPGTTVNIAIGAGGTVSATAGSDGGSGTDTWLNWSNSTQTSSPRRQRPATSGVLAKGGGGGTAATSGAGGVAASSFGDLTYSGGSGGSLSGLGEPHRLWWRFSALPCTPPETMAVKARGTVSGQGGGIHPSVSASVGSVSGPNTRFEEAAAGVDGTFSGGGARRATVSTGNGPAGSNGGPGSHLQLRLADRRAFPAAARVVRAAPLRRQPVARAVLVAFMAAVAAVAVPA